MSQSFIPFANPHAAYAVRSAEMLDAVRRVLESGVYIMGTEVTALEEAFSQWLGKKEENGGMPMQVLGVANGTDAIELILRGFFTQNPELSPASQVRKGYKGAAVFTVSHTAVATVAAIERAGCVPVLCDIDPHSLTLCPQALEKAVQRAKEAHLAPVAVVPVHIYGHPCAVDDILAVAMREGLFVLEDCAQAVGSTYKGRKVGTLGHAAAISCYPTKNFGALGDAGLVCTADTALMEDMRALAQYGWKDRYISALAGINTRLDPVQAAILGVNLRYLDADISQRQAIGAGYSAALAGLGSREHAPVHIPHTGKDCGHSFHLYVLRVPTKSGGSARRDKLLHFLRERQVGASLHYPMAVHKQPAYAGRVLMSADVLSHTDVFYDELLTLPLFPQMSEEERERVTDAVLAFKE